MNATVKVIDTSKDKPGGPIFAAKVIGLLLFVVALLTGAGFATSMINSAYADSKARRLVELSARGCQQVRTEPAPMSHYWKTFLCPGGVQTRILGH